MALPPLPPSNTERWFLDYTVGSQQHSLLMRATTILSAVEACTALDVFLTAIAGNLVEIVPVGLRHASIGSDVTNPADFGTLAEGYGTGTVSSINRPLQVTFTGRSTDGRKNRVGIYGWTAQTDSSWRITTLEDSDVLLGVNALTSLASSGKFCTISGQRAIWHSYANIGYNDYWVNQARRGA